MSGQGERQAAETEKGDPFLKGSPCHPTLAGLTGLEPATSGVTGRRSNQTELRPPKNLFPRLISIVPI